MTSPRKQVSKKRLGILLVLIAAAFGVLLYQGLSGATVYFRTADQAVAQKNELGTKQFRIEGTVVNDSVHKEGTKVKFKIAGNTTTVSVIHSGDEPELFREGIPVVLEGHFAGNTFESSRILVKHSETYSQKNPSRVKDYQQ